MIAFIVCLLNLISIFFEINYIIILGLNPSLTPSLVPLMYLWWILLSDIIIQIGLAVVNILYLLWSMLTCCAAKENTLLKFGIMKSITIFYFIGSSLFVFYKFFENIDIINQSSNFFYLLLIYFISFCLIVLVFVIYRIILCYKKRNEPKYSHLVSDENHIEINLLENN
jgi:hypothetical protein